MQLHPNSLLQGGKYKIESVLGQGGFGITYLGWQTRLNRRVAIKEFFMKEYCNRNADTSHITIGTEGSRELVARFQQKFIKEAQSIAGLNHPNIIRIHDVFEENDTAYYVMEYIEGGSLQEYVTRYGALQGNGSTALHPSNSRSIELYPPTADEPSGCETWKHFAERRGRSSVDRLRTIQAIR